MFSHNMLPQLNKEDVSYNKITITTEHRTITCILKSRKELAILAVKISFPNRAKYPRLSHDALRCDAQMSPSAKIPFHSNSTNTIP